MGKITKTKMTQTEFDALKRNRIGLLVIPDGTDCTEIDFHGAHMVAFGRLCELGDEANLGDRCKLDSYCKLGNECVLGNGCQLGYRCELGEGCKLGSYCTLLPECKIGTGCTLGGEDLQPTEVPNA